MKNKTFGIVLGIILFVPMVGVFFMDRLISAFLFWLTKKPLIDFLETPTEMAAALIRCAVFSLGAWVVYFFFL